MMELCTGGSLFNLLDDPENNFGLDEDEWILVLSHLSAGMNHLRDNNLVHRYVHLPLNFFLFFGLSCYSQRSLGFLFDMVFIYLIIFYRPHSGSPFGLPAP